MHFAKDSHDSLILVRGNWEECDGHVLEDCKRGRRKETDHESNRIKERIHATTFRR